jgi:TolA-binding protein
VSWTPTILILDPSGIERYRIEGYLPKPEFRAELEFGLARVAFKNKKWSAAEKVYSEIAKHYSGSFIAPEATYWAGVSQYQRTHDPKILGETARSLAENFSDSVWSKKASVWL